MKTETESYWMQPRDLMNLEDEGYKMIKALIAYRILFNGILIISDSDLVNNYNLRNCIRDDSVVKELIERQFIQFALREFNGTINSLGKTAESVLGTEGYSKKIPKECYCNSPELKFVEENAKIRSFSFSSAGERYTREIVKLFCYLSQSDRYHKSLPRRYSRMIQLELLERIANNQQASWSWFVRQSEFMASISKKLGCANLSREQFDFIFNAARGPYATFIPESLKINACYSIEDVLGIELWRRRVDIQSEILEKMTLQRSRISLVDFTNGLSSLTANQVIKLRNSSYRKAYDNACQSYATDMKDGKEAIQSLHEYRRIIDAAILRNSKVKETTDEEYQVSIAEQYSDLDFTTRGQWIKFALNTLASKTLGNLTLGLWSLAEFAFEQIFSRPKEIDKFEIQKEIKIEEWNRDKENKVLDGKHIIMNSSRDFFTKN